VLACGLLGLGFYQLHNTLQTLATQMAPAARGTALSLFAFCFFLGQAVGVSAGALVVDQFGAAWLFAASALILPFTGMLLARNIKARSHLSCA
jgi:predicted MFS family arabinose efflux permease